DGRVRLRREVRRLRGERVERGGGRSGSCEHAGLVEQAGEGEHAEPLAGAGEELAARRAGRVGEEVRQVGHRQVLRRGGGPRITRPTLCLRRRRVGRVMRGPPRQIQSTYTNSLKQNSAWQKSASARS